MLKKIIDFLNIFIQYSGSLEGAQVAVSQFADDLHLMQLVRKEIASNGQSELEVESEILYRRYDTLLISQADYSERIGSGQDACYQYDFWLDDVEQPQEDLDEQASIIPLIVRLFYVCHEVVVRNRKEDTAKTHDIRSGVFNAEGYLEEGQKKIDQGLGGRYSAVYLNIIRFKLVNQMYGHQVGDLVLEEVARRVEFFARAMDKDSIVGRLSGDTFVAMIPNEVLPSFLSAIRNLTIHVQSDEGGYDIPLSFFTGVYSLGAADRDMSAAMENASVAHYMARHKETGEPVYYDEELHKQILREKDVESRMRDALDNKEFVVYYQPKVDLDTYCLSGAEALVRWIDHGRLTPPDEFIPIFEKNGFICNVDFYVLNSVCRALRKWLEQGLDVVTVSVNFSRAHFANQGFTDQIINVVKRHRIPARYIEIEFTETMDFQDKERLIQATNKLKAYGIATSMDDFGTGYSSLSLLKSLSVDTIKIDKSLIDHSESGRDKAIIENVIRMARDMDIDIIAEGVETKEQASFLKSIGSERVQGFLFDKPLPIEEFEKRLIHKHYDEV
ncbi:MAG: bifunctional diguanylate cyclase/phosphodiesterase [Lachnospiraceae bacterium]|nr:bifunctional diguanylate cyclase/phosphodiesterase [Lachnospiraceae bacterium]